GVDIIKNYYTGTAEGFRTVVESCPIPIMIAGGIRSDSTRATLESIKDAMTAGARGAVIGRNIWQHPNPAGMTRAISRIIHEDITVEEALDVVQEAVHA